MPVIVDVGLKEMATIKAGVWNSANSNLAEILSIFTPLDIETYTPWPDYTLAQMAAEALGGKIIEATDPPEYVEGRVY
jgi:hypothetical protein